MPGTDVWDSVALSVAERDEVRRILAAHVPEWQVWVFGSRVTGKAKPMSDLDLGLEGMEALPLGKEADLTEAFAESDLPFRVDVVDLLMAHPAFVERVKREGVLL